jgi:magnesium transporter
MKNPKHSQQKKVKKAGLPPGSVIFTGNQKVDKIFVHHLQYRDSHIQESVFDNHRDITFHASKDEQVDWYDMRGLHDTALIDALGKTFHIHPLVLEDVADIHQRPKFDEYENGIFITIRALHFDPATLEIKTEQIAIFFRTGLVVSFQESDSDLFAAVRHRIHTASGRIRSRGADYLAYALIDNIVDNYFGILEKVETAIEEVEVKLLTYPDNGIKSRIHHLKVELLTARKAVAPLREAISRFARCENEFINEKTIVFVRDLYDHTIQVMDMVESYRDMLNGLQDLYLSEISFKMNQVMQVLTIITTIFVPLSFLAGLYGMNFDHMPELHMRYGYFFLLGLMFLIFLGSLFYFKKKKWI